ncbi:MAG: ABC transporter ATP-binding protein [Spirochaetales bacterium]|nr:ABC transporter ATP-binding protein [Spirochaetales bacterium]
MDISTIQVTDLEYSYGSVKAVRGVSFEVGRGEILGFLGPNGAGKTTTVKILTGLLPPQKGEVIVLGNILPNKTRKMQARIGVSFEKTNLYEQMSAKENLLFYSRLFRISSFDPLRILERVGLAGRENDRVESYSKGMKQRLMVARALINPPDILFLDEPTDGLDPVSAETIRKIILEEKERGASIFLTTHDMSEADRLADRVAFINQGEIAAIDRPALLKQNYGERALNVEVLGKDGEVHGKKIILDDAASGARVRELLETEKVVTMHSAEATLEDIFIQITGRGLA